MYHGRVSTKGRIEGTAYDKKIPSNQATWFGSTNMKCADAVQIPSSFLKPTGKATAPAPPPLARTGRVVNFGQPKVPANAPPITKLKVKEPGSVPPPAAPEAQPQTSSSAGAPAITASSKSVAIPPGQNQGSTVVAWDGGAEHPYAEVWVKVDDADETFVVEKGKGSRQMTVERGKTYVYILTDSGQQLATVTVKAK